jgi:Tfp pilus assembly protein PilV
MRRRGQLRSRALGGEDGFGLIELLIAMTILTVAIGALIAVFGNSIVSLQHSAKEGTAITLADRQLESYRSMPFSCIPDASFPPATTPVGCGTYSGFPNPYASTQITSSTESPDHRTYKVTTEVRTSASPGPDYGCGGTTQIKVTVALNSGGPVLAKETSCFSSAGTA